MFALFKDAFSVARSLITTNQQPLSGYGPFRVFTSSQIQSKFRKAQPTEAELLEMSPALRYYYEKLREDPEFRRDRVEYRKLVTEKWRQRRQDDPEFYKQELARWNNLSRSDEYRLRKAFYEWLRRVPESQRLAYAWKTHLPVVFRESRGLTCSVCSGHPTNSRVWWKSLDSHDASRTSDAQEYTCHSCYMDQDKSEIFPAELQNHDIGSRKRWPKPYKPYHQVD